MTARPAKFRKLTREEAANLGVSYTAKRRVDASLKRITKRTKLYTDREVAQVHISEKVGHKTTKEANTKTRQYKDAYSTRYLNVKKQDFGRISKLAKGHTTQILAYGNNGETKYGVNPENKFSATPMIGQDELQAHLDRLYSERGLLGFNAENQPARIDIRIRFYGKDNIPASVMSRVKRSKHSKKRGK